MSAWPASRSRPGWSAPAREGPGPDPPEGRDPGPAGAGGRAGAPPAGGRGRAPPGWGSGGGPQVQGGRWGELAAEDPPRLPEMCERLLANPLIEDYEIQDPEGAPA